MSELTSIILAAGQGTRMKSKYPKVLHKLLGRPMLQYVVDTSRQVGAKSIIVVIGFGGDLVQKELGPELQYVWQKEQLGTGHAVRMAEAVLKNLSGDLLVLYGDTPLLQADTVLKLVEAKRSAKATAAILTTLMSNPSGYGRIVRNQDGNIIGIVEDKDASAAQKEIKEVNTGVYCFDIQELLKALPGLSPRNAQGEYYLTDVFKAFVDQGLTVTGLITEAAEQVMGPNDRIQLAATENYLRQAINKELMKEGVTIVDPATTYIGPEVKIGRDSIIKPGTIILGRTEIGEDCIIGPYTKIENSTVKAGTEIQFSQICEATIGPDNTIGPYAYIRPGTITANQVKVGDFVELKNTTIDSNSKVPHLTYLGDTKVGKEVNIGAGTITCNYDGVNKHQTVISDRAFIGSNSNLVAPVIIGTCATVGAGSTITKEVPGNSLGISRSRQENIPNWKSPRERSGKK